MLLACRLTSESRDAYISPALETTRSLVLLVDVNLVFLFRFQGKLAEHDKPQRKKKGDVNEKELS